jgi:DNA-binding MarR family transcriptional regulator
MSSKKAGALVDVLAQTTFVVMGALTRVGATYDLSLTQMRVLGILRDRRPRMAELANFLGLDKSTMSGLVERAERRGLLVRGKNVDDRRAIDVFMTRAGRKLADQVHADVSRELAAVVSRLDGAEQQLLTRLLGQMLGPAAE